MGTQTAAAPSFTRFTRNGFGFTQPSRTDTRSKPRNADSDDDWYIPYNGPYEPPKNTAPRRKRDSWGDPVDGIEDDMGLDDKELHLRYGTGMEEERKGRSRDRTFSGISGRTTSSDAVDPSRASVRTTTTKRRSTISASSPPAVPPPSFISLDSVGGGVGESPIPHSTRRNSKDTNDANRISIASMFSFGGGGSNHRVSPAGRKPTIAPLNTKQEKGRGIAGLGNKQRQLHDRVKLNAERLSSTATDDEDYYNSYYSTLLNPNDKVEVHHQVQARFSPITPTSPGSSNSHGGGGGVSRQNSVSTNSGHPYAYVYPKALSPIASAADVTRSANLTPKLTFTTPPHTATGGFPPRLGVNAGPTSPGLKGSISTPNLRNPVVGTSHMNVTTTNSEPQTPPSFVFPKGKDRWLSAETWCDALLFPRPRLKLKHQPPLEEEAGGSRVVQLSTSGRIVSPPATPLPEAEFGVLQKAGGWERREAGVASRVLAHSRSLVDLRNKTQTGGGGKERDMYDDTFASSAGVTVVRSKSTTQRAKKSKWANWSQDDLALPAPVPSLDHVLREGEQLELDRREWKRQATGSFGNKRTRSMSRTRTKSLSRKGRQDMGVGAGGGLGGHHHQSSVEYIAARAYLGSQGVAMNPSVGPTRPNTSSSNETTAGTTMHSHSTSLAKSLSKSSKSHSRTNSHSRNNSLSKSAIKLAKATVTCVYPNSSTTPAEGNTTVVVADKSSSIIGTGSFRGPPDLEGALKKDGTRVIRLADPAHLPLDRGAASSTPGASTSALGHANAAPLLAQAPAIYVPARTTPSPYDSLMRESRVGIAVGTPSPGGEEESDTDGGYSTYVPAHPYAQGGLSFSTRGEVRQQGPPQGPPQSQHGRQHGNFAGPHLSIIQPSSTAGSSSPPISETLARHKLSPHLAALQMAPHPYAQPMRDSYIEANGLIGQHRSEGTPHAAKMWAQLSPGVVREILAGDLVYSPYLGESGALAPEEKNGPGGNGVEVRDDDDDDLKERGPLNIHDATGADGRVVDLSRSGEMDDPLPEFTRVRSRKRNGVHLVPSRSVDLGESQQQPFEQTADLDIEYMPHTTQEQLEKDEDEDEDEDEGRKQSMSISTDASSPNLSPPQSTPGLGSPDNLSSFQDLFYRPSVNSMPRTPHEAALPESPYPPHNISNSPRGSDISWDISLKNRGTGSSLTSLARQLTNEFEQMALERERDGTSSQYSNSHSYENHRRSQSTSALSSRHQSGLSGVFGGAGAGGLARRPTLEGTSLRFVFEEMMPLSESPPNGNEGLSMGMGLAAPIHAFSPSSDTLPEDVQASGASSLMETDEEDDPTAIYRVGTVESVSTPPITPSMRRNSFLGTVFVHDSNADPTTQRQEQEQAHENENEDEQELDQDHHTTVRRASNEEVESPESRAARILSGLQPPLTDVTRSSYMTTSTTSRISNLSDFPVPPRSHHDHTDDNSGYETTNTLAHPEQQQNDLSTPSNVSLLRSYFNEAMFDSESRAELGLGDLRDSPAMRSAAALRSAEALLEEHRAALRFSVDQERGR